jgi:hypothetical protein
MANKKRILSMVIDGTCEECPYCNYSLYCNMDNNSGFNCEHPQGNINRIINHNDFNVSKNNWPPIPEGCPLPKKKEE